MATHLRTVKQYAARPVKMTAYLKSIVKWMRARVIQIDGEATDHPHMYNMDLIARYAPGMDGRSYNKRAELADVVLNQLKFTRGDWQFLMFAFYKDPVTGVEQYSSELLPPFHGNAMELDAHVSPLYNEFVGRSRNTSFVSYGNAAIPSGIVDVTDELEDTIVGVLAGQGCYDREHVEKLRMARRLAEFESQA